MILPFISTAVQSACILWMISMMYFGKKWSRFGRLDTAAEWERASFTAGCGSIGQLQSTAAGLLSFSGQLCKKTRSPQTGGIGNTTTFLYDLLLFLIWDISPSPYMLYWIYTFVDKSNHSSLTGQHFSNWILFIILLWPREKNKEKEKNILYFIIFEFLFFLFFIYFGEKEKRIKRRIHIRHWPRALNKKKRRKKEEGGGYSI